MNILAVDDEFRALHTLEEAILAAKPKASVACFDEAPAALAYAENHTIDVAFLDIRMGGMDGLALARRLKDLHAGTNIIFVTGYGHYAVDAFDLNASGYVMKPIDLKQVARQMENLRHPVQEPDRGVRIQCFGNFEVFVDGKPVSFARSKAKEILAYLVDRHGACASKKELAAILWEDDDYSRSKQIQLQTLIAEMLRALKQAGAQDFILKRRGLYCVEPDKISCDYYRYIKGDAAAVNLYRGEYMTNYSWAEFTTGSLAK